MAYKDVILADSPGAYWRLNDVGTTAADSAGSHTGTLTGTITKSVSGALVGDPDTAMSFNGSTGYIDFAATPFDLTASFSVELWWDGAGMAAWANPIQSRLAGKGGFGWYNDTSSTTTWKPHLSVTSGDVETANWTTTTTYAIPFSPAGYKHIVWTWDTTTARFYVNGVLDTNTTVVGYGGYGGTTGAWIGRSYTGYVSAKLDEVAIYPSALSAAKVLTHYSVGITQPLPRSLGLRQAGKRAAYY